jgi:capsular polysaccharide biosynthesis protein
MNEKSLQLELNEVEETEIDLLDLAKYIFQHWIPVVLVTVLGAVIAFLITSFAITPQYEAKSSIYVVSATANSAFDLSDLNFGTSLTNDYKKLVTSRTMFENVIADTGEDLTVKQLTNMLTVGNETGTRILEFTITSPDPDQAMRLANSFAGQAIIFLPEVMGVKDNVPTEVDDAILPTQPSNIRYLRNTAIGAVLGFMLIAVILVIRYMLNDTFNSAEDVEKYLGITPLAAVPENGQKHRGGSYYYYTKKGKRGKSK